MGDEISDSKSQFDIVYLIFWLGGLPLHKRSSRIYKVYNIILMFCAHTTVLAMVMDTIFHSQNLKSIMPPIRVIAPGLDNFWIFHTLRLKRKSVERLTRLAESFKWKDLPYRDPQTGKLTMAGMIPHVSSIVKILFFGPMVFHMIQTTARMMRKKEHMFSTWYPFDTTGSPNFEITFFSEGITTLYYLSIIAAFPGLYVLLVCIAGSQMEKVKLNLLNIRQNQLKFMLEQDNRSNYGNQQNEEEEDGMKPFAPQEAFRSMKNQLNECIVHHQKVKMYMREIENTLNITMLGHFFIIFSILCVSAFSAVTNWGDMADVSQTMVIYTIYSLSILMFCWFGNELTNRAESVRDGAYGCEWIGTPVPFQKCIVFITAAANDEFTLTAGKFVPVSNKTLMNIMNQTLSFFMFLMEVKKRIEEPSHIPMENI